MVQEVKIAFYSDSVEIGGAENYLRLLASGLKNKGHEIIVYFPNVLSTGDYLAELETGGIKVKSVTSDPGELRSWLEAEKADILHFNLPDAFSCGPEIELAGKIQGPKLMATVHSLSRAPNIKVNPSVKSWIVENIPFWSILDGLREKMWRERGKAARLLSSLDRVIAVSEASKKELISTFNLPPDKISVVYNGIPLKKYPDRREARKVLGFDLDTPLIACIGRLVKNKGQDIFLKAAALIKREKPEVRFLITGDGYLKNSLQKSAQRLGLSNEVVFLGYDKVPWVFGAMDISAVPSLSETFSYTVAESMAAGKPVAASAVGGIPEIIEDSGLLVRPSDPQALKETLMKLLNDQQLRQEMGAAGKSRIEDQFNLDKMIKNTVKTYAQ